MSSFSPLSFGSGSGVSQKAGRPVITHRELFAVGDSLLEVDASTGALFDDKPYKLRLTNPNTFALYLYFLVGSELFTARSIDSYDVVVPPESSGECDFFGDRCAISSMGTNLVSPVPVSVSSVRYFDL